MSSASHARDTVVTGSPAARTAMMGGLSEAWRRGVRQARVVDSRTPLRVRLLAAMLVLVTAGLLASGIGAYAALRSSLIGRVDQQTTSLASQIVNTASHSYDRDLVNPQLPTLYFVRINNPDGTTYRDLAPMYGQASVPRLPVVTYEQAQTQRGPFTVDSMSSGPHWRCQVLLVRNLPGYSVTVAYSLGDVEQTLHRLALVETVIGLVVLVLLGLLGHLAIRSSLRPLLEIEGTAQAVAAGDLSRRVRERDPRTEVGRLGRAFNVMVGQIEQAFHARAESAREAQRSEERMRRFIGDASHELRTPLTSIRGYAELFRQGAVSEPADVAKVVGRIEGEAVRMTGLVEDLLLLARLDQQRPLNRTSVDLVRLAEDAVADARAVQPRRPVELDLRVSEARVLGDEARLRQVLANLVRNALVHTPREARITVRVGQVDDAAVLEVADEGPGMAPEDASRIFERFFRADASRAREDGGSGYGLGLAIVAALVAAHGGTVGVETALGRGALFRVVLPVAAASPPAVPNVSGQHA